MEALRAYWAVRAPRERMMLAGGGAVAIVLLLYLFVWDPIQSSRARLAAELPKLREQAAQFRIDTEQVQALRGRMKADGGQPLPALLESSSKAAGIRDSIKQIQTLSDDRAQINVTNVGFDALVRWLATIGTSDGITVETINASRAGQSGRVQVESMVVRSPRAQ